MMGNYERDESHFSPAIAAMDEGVRPRLGLGDLFDEDIFTVSGCNTPLLEAAPVIDAVNASTRGHHGELCISTIPTDRSKNDAQKSDVTSDNILVERSRPIPIESAKPKSAALIEPVSARGDLAVAYFPMHEKEGDIAQIYQPHPFGQEVKRARQRSISEAEASAATVERAEAHIITSSSTGPATYAVPRAQTASAVRIAREDEPAATGPKRRADPPWRARTAPIVEAYNPTGIPGSAASLGKYYPTNYEASDAADSADRLPRPASELSFSLSRPDQAHRLRQYQRDMISQTLQKAREALGRTMQSTASIKAAETVLDDGSRKSVASGIALLRRYKPLSPRITPLLSPGPVTPMALDGDGELDYITVREARPR